MAQIKIETSNYPQLEELMRKNPQKAKELMGVFIECMNEAAENKWYELPDLFARNELTFSDLIKGILHGSLDLPKMNPEAYDALREEVHPLSMLSVRKDYLSGGYRNYNWRQHYRLPHTALVNQETVAEIFRKLLRYYKYVKVDDLANALVNNQIATFKSLHEAENLPFYPALRYQKEHFGELQVGKFFTDIGAFDGGTLPSLPMEGEWEGCPACQSQEDFWQVKDKIVCPRCNIGFEVE
jgi:hypothetical protein